MGCHVTTTYPTHFGKFWLLKKNLNEHGGGMGGHLGVQQRKPKEFFSIVWSTIMKFINQG
jgi:hypothetical protein